MLWCCSINLCCFAACVFRLLVSLPSGCRPTIVLCVCLVCVSKAPVPLACHAYCIKLRFVLKSLIRHLVTCWRCFPFNTLGFCPCQCQRRERRSFPQLRANTLRHCTRIKTRGTLWTYPLHRHTITNPALIQILMHPHTLKPTHTHTSINTHIGGSQPPADFNSPPESSLSVL